MEVLRADPDTDTVRALDQLATLEVFAGSPDADRLTAEALTLGQALDVDTGQLGDLFLTRGIYLTLAGGGRSDRLPTRERAARRAGRRQLPPGTRAAQPVGRTGGHRPCSRGGGRPYRRRASAPDRRSGTTWPCAIMNLVQALLLLGDWDAAEQELTQALDSDGLADVE